MGNQESVTTSENEPIAISLKMGNPLGPIMRTSALPFALINAETKFPLTIVINEQATIITIELGPEKTTHFNSPTDFWLCTAPTTREAGTPSEKWPGPETLTAIQDQLNARLEIRPTVQAMDTSSSDQPATTAYRFAPTDPWTEAKPSVAPTGGSDDDCSGVDGGGGGDDGGGVDDGGVDFGGMIEAMMRHHHEHPSSNFPVQASSDNHIGIKVLGKDSDGDILVYTECLPQSLIDVKEFTVITIQGIKVKFMRNCKTYLGKLETKRKIYISTNSSTQPPGYCPEKIWVKYGSLFAAIIRDLNQRSDEWLVLNPLADQPPPEIGTTIV